MKHVAQFFGLTSRRVPILPGVAAITLTLIALSWLLDKGMAQAPTVNTSASYPAVGHTYQFDFGRLAFKNEYSADGKQMTFTRLSDGRTGTVQYTASEVRPNLFWNYWVESDGTSVVRAEDFEQGIVHAAVHFSDGRVVNLKGTFKKID